MQNAGYHQLITGMMNNQSIRWPDHLTDDDSALFIDYAQQHGVLALLNQFQPQPDSDNWPALIKQSIAIADKASEQILLIRKQTIIRIFDAFEKNNIDALVFKGAANAYLLYEQPHHRAHADIDILIRETDFQSLKTCLTAMGFEFDTIEPTQYGPSQSSATLVQAGITPIIIDIHWKINNRLALANTLEFGELKQRSIAVEQYGKMVRAFSYEDAILAACIHEAGSLEIEKGKLISLYDVYLLLHKLNVKELETLTIRAHGKKIGEVYRQYLKQCLSTFDNPTLANKVNNVLEKVNIDQYELSKALLKRKQSWLSNQLLDLRSVDGTIAKLTFILSKLKSKL